MTVDLDEVQHAYDQALRRLLLDLETATEDRIDIPEVLVDFTDPELPYSFVDPDGSSHGTSFPSIDDIEEATVALANPFQDDVLEFLWGQAWPPCPGHSHPAEPALVDSYAVWRCPYTGDPVALIGTLGS